MTDITETDLRGAIKALTDVITPAIDPTDHLAREQMRLVVEYLEFLRSRFMLLPERERLDLRHAMSLVRRISGELPPADPQTAALDAALTDAERALASPDASIAQLRRSAVVLSALTRETLRAARLRPAAERRRIETAALEESEARVAFERAWFLPMRLDPSPGDVQPVESFFDRRDHHQATGDSRR